MARSLTKSAKGEKLKPYEKPLDIALRFARSKASPAAGFIANVATGEDYRGRPITVGEAALEMVDPLIRNDFMEGYNVGGGKLVGGLSVLPGLAGVGYSAWERGGQVAGGPNSRRRLACAASGSARST